MIIDLIIFHLQMSVFEYLLNFFDEDDLKDYLTSILGKMNNMNIRYYNLNEDLSDLSTNNTHPYMYWPKYCFKFNNKLYLPYDFANRRNNIPLPITFWNEQYQSMNYKFIQSVYNDLVKFLEFFTDDDLIFQGLYYFKYDRRGRAKIVKTSFNPNYHTRSSNINKIKRKHYDEILLECKGLEYLMSRPPTLDEIRQDILNQDEELEKLELEELRQSYKNSLVKYIFG